jgi:hypothetical protein
MAAIGASGLLGANPNGEVGQSTSGGKKTIGDTLGTLMPGYGGGDKGKFGGGGGGSAMDGLNQVNQGANAISNSIQQAGSSLGVGTGSPDAITMKKGGKVKKFADGGSVLKDVKPPTRSELKRQMAEEVVKNPKITPRKKVEIFREGMTPPQDDEGPVQSLKPIKQAKGGNIQSIEDIPPLPNAPYRTPEQKKKDMDKAKQEWNKGERKLPSSTLGDAMKNLKNGGKVSSASSRGDGIAQKGKTKGRIIGMSYGGKC